MTVVAGAPATSRRGRGARLPAAIGPLLATAVAVGVFWLLHPSVGDLQAAIAREEAAASGVGATYWFTWYGGISPGSYSLIVPLVSLLTGSVGLLALSTLAITALGVPLSRGTAHPAALRWGIAAAAVLNMVSGRVAFAAGAAIALGGIWALRGRRHVLGALLLGLSGFASPLAPAFVGLVAVPLLAGSGHRSPGVRAVLAGAGLGVVLPVALFGAPGAQSFPWTTLAWMALAMAGAWPTLRGTPQRWLVPLAALASLVLFVVPTGVGSNLSRFACLVLPCVCLAWSGWSGRALAVALLPALACGVYVATADQVAGSGHPSGDYDGLRTAIMDRADADHRVELIDNRSRAGSHLLGADVALARGWENQSDARYHALFHEEGELDAGSYRAWLLENAVGHVALATDPLPLAAEEAELVRSGLPYLTEVWRDENWVLYEVDDPSPIVPAPLELVDASPAELVIEVPDTRAHQVQVRPNRYLVARSASDPEVMACLAPTEDDWITLQAPAPGTYVLAGDFTLAAVLDGDLRACE